MKKNPLRFLALLGLLGFLAFFTDNHGYLGYFGFFAFFSFYDAKFDEMLQHNLARAGLNAFIVSMVGVTVSIAVLSIAQTLAVAGVCLAVVFVAQILTFVISLTVYEKRG